jgi:hypothetical protein
MDSPGLFLGIRIFSIYPLSLIEQTQNFIDAQIINGPTGGDFRI